MISRSVYISQNMFSLHMIKQREMKIMIIARSASMKANGASTEKREKLQNNNLEQPLQRMSSKHNIHRFLTYFMFIVLNNTDGESHMTH